jgi:hypothetical protein
MATTEEMTAFSLANIYLAFDSAVEIMDIFTNF